MLNTPVGALAFFKEENEPFKGLMKIEKGADMCGTFRIYAGRGERRGEGVYEKGLVSNVNNSRK